MNAATPHTSVVTLSTVVLARARWRRRPDGSWDVQHGTWTAVRSEGLSPFIAPVVGCPRCGHAIVIATEDAVKMGGGRVTHEIGADGRIKPEVRCRHVDVLGSGERRPCGFARPVMLERWQDERPIWCCIYTRSNSAETHEVYSHATTRAEALRHTLIGGRTLVAIGPAVGWKGQAS